MSSIVSSLPECGPQQEIRPGFPDNPPSRQQSTRPEIQKPGPGRSISEFADEAGRAIGRQSKWFVRNDRVVEIREKVLSETLTSTVFHEITPVEARSGIEAYVRVGSVRNNMFHEESISSETAAALLNSKQFKEHLPRIFRILDVEIPFIHNGEIVYPQRGYDQRFGTYCPETAPAREELSLKDAKNLLKDMISDFPFADEQSVVNALARLLTPFCRGLMGFNARPPVFIYEANRPRAGKDYLAMCTQIIYEGRANEDAPLDAEPEETRKRITAALQSGRRFMHLSNCDGFCRNNSLEQIATAHLFSGRRLGSNDAGSDLTLPNEIEFSLSANSGFQYSEDLELRSRKITLEYSEENANARTFSRPDLHGWIKNNRGRFLGAMAALVSEWDRQGRPSCTTPFTSFPRWAEVIGGILQSCGIGDPCISKASLTGDEFTEEMKKLYRAAHDQYGATSVRGTDLRSLVQEHGIFPFYDLAGNRGHQTAFGKKLHAFNKRILDGIQMQIDPTDKTRPRFIFTRQHAIRDTGLVSKALIVEPPANRDANLANFANLSRSVLEEDTPASRGIKVSEVNNVRKNEVPTVITIPACDGGHFSVNTGIPTPPVIIDKEGGIRPASNVTDNGKGAD